MCGWIVGWHVAMCGSVAVGMLLCVLVCDVWVGCGLVCCCVCWYVVRWSVVGWSAVCVGM